MVILFISLLRASAIAIALAMWTAWVPTDVIGLLRPLVQMAPVALASIRAECTWATSNVATVDLFVLLRIEIK